MDKAAAGLGPFEAVGDLSYDVAFPAMLPVQQKVDAPQVADVAAATRAALEPLRARVTAGMSVAITAGSRGIADKPAVVRAAGEWLRSVGAEPFVVPAMGSHGGATPEGQVELLGELGMTEQSVGMPIRATMDTARVGQVPGGPEVHLDAYAAEADGILAVNRVKAHTDFSGELESGVGKIVAIGLGKQRGAEGVHRFGPANLGTWIPRVARHLVDTGKVLGGLAILENAHDRAARIELLEPADIAGPGEAQLLLEAKQLMGRLPFDDIDVAVVDAMGKNVSGSGMDTNVIGRMMIRGSPEFEGPNIRNIAVLDLTDESHGNSVGVGLADFVPFRLMAKVDLRATYVNAMTSGLGGPQRAQLPITLPTDRDAVAAAILTCGRPDTAQARVVRMRSTLDLEDLLVSEALRDEVLANDRLTITGEPSPLAFGPDGRITGWS
ncbi:MAG: DUF2088 domain-containing protein [Streptosporangiales bacterium]|nr:DUF2088 domain-containing protein [Streptosporangiales bacterium]